MRPRSSLALWVLPIACAVLLLRLTTMPRLIEHADGVNFVRGVLDYSVPRLRPHFPGYPVFIWLGKLLHLLVGDPALALHLLSALCSTLSLWPVAWIAQGWREAGGGTPGQSFASGVFAAVLVSLPPIVLTLGNEIFADPTALLLALGLLLCCTRAISAGGRGTTWLVGAGALAGLVPGARLTYVGLLLPLGVALALAPARDLPRLRRRRLRAVALGVCVVAVGAWLTWQLALDGPGLFHAARIHLSGHFTKWGGSALDDPGLLARPYRFAETTVVAGLGLWWPGQPAYRLPASAILLLLTLAGGLRLLRSQARWPLWLLLCWSVPYTTGALIGHDPANPRHVLPLVPPVVLLAAVGLPARATRAVAVTLVTVAALATVSVPIALVQRDTPRLGYKVTSWLQQRSVPGRSMLLVPRDATSVAFAAEQVLAPSAWQIVREGELLAVARELHAQELLVFATTPSSEDPQEWAPVARLCRKRILDFESPAEVWLFRYQPDGWTGPLPDCS